MRHPVITLAAAVLALGIPPATRAQAPDVPLPPDVRQVGTLRHVQLKESSGLAACRMDSKIFWTHNDGRHRILYAIDREGHDRGSVQIMAPFEDWEDIASNSRGQLYLADTGNNKTSRTEVRVYEVDEPDPREMPRTLSVKRTWRLRFPKEVFDCESLFVWQGHGYLISKVFDDNRAGVYRFALKDEEGPVVLHRVTRLRVDSPVTGADISRDGQKLAIVSKAGAAVFEVNGDLRTAGDVKPFWTKFRHEHIEACCFVPDGLLATAESREVYLFTAPAFRPGR